MSVIVRLTCMQSSVHGHKQDAEVVYCLLLLLLLIVNIYVCNYSAEIWFSMLTASLLFLSGQMFICDLSHV